jgi:hypothetical protein
MSTRPKYIVARFDFASGKWSRTLSDELTIKRRGCARQREGSGSGSVERAAAKHHAAAAKAGCST